MNKYVVISPEYTEYENIGSGLNVPSEVQDFVEVEAKTTRQAKVLGVRKFRKLCDNRWDDTPYSAKGENPFKGVKVKLMVDCICPTLAEEDEDDYCPIHGTLWESDIND
jgi:hypothetical protein